MITYDIELRSSGKEIGFNLIDDQDFTIPYITDNIPNLPAGHQLPSQAKRNVWIVAINGESLSQLKVYLMNSIFVNLRGVNQSDGAVE